MQPYFHSFLNMPKLLRLTLIVASFTLTACQDTTNIPKSSKTTTRPADASDSLVGCYTVTKTEPAQIKINLDNDNYNMQMRQFNDPDKPWDAPEPLQRLPKADSKTYFDIEEKSMEKAVIRPDKVFALAKVQDSLMNLDSRFDSNYLGYIAKDSNAKGSNTVYKVDCGN